MHLLFHRKVTKGKEVSVFPFWGPNETEIFEQSLSLQSLHDLP